MRRLLRGRAAGVLPQRRDAACQRRRDERDMERGRSCDSRERGPAEETKTQIEVAARSDNYDDDGDDHSGRAGLGRQQLHLS